MEELKDLFLSPDQPKQIMIKELIGNQVWHEINQKDIHLSDEVIVSNGS